MEAVKFPTMEVNFSDGSSLKLPITSDTMNVPKVSMLCLSFRANSQVLYIYISLLMIVYLLMLLDETKQANLSIGYSYAYS